MAGKQEIPNSNGDYIESPRSANWQKGECAPVWSASTYSNEYSEEYA